MSEHIVSRKVYFGVFGALIVLTVVTVVVAEWDLPGRLNVIVALAVAMTKAVLVVLYFMHIKYSSRLTQVVVVTGIVWLVILIALTMADYRTRGWFNAPGAP